MRSLSFATLASALALVLPHSALASKHTRLELDTYSAMEPADIPQASLQELLADEGQRSPAVLDLPTDRPSGESAQAILDHERTLDLDIERLMLEEAQR